AAERIKKTLESGGLGLSIKDALKHAESRGVKLYEVAYFKILEEFAKKANDPSLSKLARMVNVMALSASASILDLDFQILARAIRFIFRSKSKVAELNVQAADYIYNYAKMKFPSGGCSYLLQARQPDPNTMIVQGSQSSAMGKMVAGCRFQT